MTSPRHLREPSVQARVMSVPAIGPGGRLPRSALRLRVVVLVVVVVLLLVAGVLTQLREPRPADPPIVGAKVVTPYLIRGGQPSDGDLLMLRNVHDVTAVVNLRQSDNEQARVAEEFGMDYLPLPMPAGEAPDAADLTALLGYLRHHSQEVVYLHDDVGGGRAVVTTAMLLAVRRPAGLGSLLDRSERRLLSADQQAALAELRRAMTGRSQTTNRYREVMRTRW